MLIVRRCWQLSVNTTSQPACVETNKQKKWLDPATGYFWLLPAPAKDPRPNCCPSSIHTPTYQQEVRPVVEHPSRRRQPRLPQLRTRSATRRTEGCGPRSEGCGFRVCRAASWPSGAAAAPQHLRRFSPGSRLRTTGRPGHGSRARRSCPAAWRPSEGRWQNGRKERKERNEDRVNCKVRPSNPDLLRAFGWKNEGCWVFQAENIGRRRVWPAAKHPPFI